MSARVEIFASKERKTKKRYRLVAPKLSWEFITNGGV